MDFTHIIIFLPHDKRLYKVVNSLLLILHKVILIVLCLISGEVGGVSNKVGLFLFPQFMGIAVEASKTQTENT